MSELKKNVMAVSVSSDEVFKWDEFKALAKKLGIDPALKTTKLVIHLEYGHLADIQHLYTGKAPVEEKPEEEDPRE